MRLICRISGCSGKRYPTSGFGRPNTSRSNCFDLPLCLAGIRIFMKHLPLNDSSGNE